MADFKVNESFKNKWFNESIYLLFISSWLCINTTYNPLVLFCYRVKNTLTPVGHTAPEDSQGAAICQTILKDRRWFGVTFYELFSLVHWKYRKIVVMCLSLLLFCCLQVLQLLIKAWKRRLTFTVGRSATTGESDTVVWNEIHHKTEERNTTGHGYPDPNYLKNVTEELASHGVLDSDNEWFQSTTSFCLN